jgi:hypothetical protein
MAFNQFPQKGGIPSGSTAGRPSGAVEGDTYYNGELGLLEIYSDGQWIPCSAPAGIPTVSAADVGTSRAYTSGAIVYTFTPGTNGGSPYGYSALASLSGANYSSTGTSTSITLSVGGPGVYSYNGTAYNGFGTSPASPSANITVTTVPQAPTIGTATASGSLNELTVTWTNAASGGKNLSAITITPYLNGTTAATARTAATTSSTSYTFTEGQLTGASAYTFKIKATNANGDSLESSASNSATMPNFTTVNYLVVAGGGGGGGETVGGGGGGGGLRSGTVYVNPGFVFTASVGPGGSGTNDATPATKGTNSSLTGNGISISGTGGGRGGNYAGGQSGSVTAGGSGGSGGGAGDTGKSGGSGNEGGYSPVEGYNGGNSGPQWSGGGGGGAGAVGVSATTAGAGGNGGAGASSSITGTATFYAGGGGGCGDSSGGTGGSGGGGSGGFGTTNPSQGNGSANSGGGGGGTRDNNNGNGYAGGSGVVILSLPSAASSTTGSPTATQSGGRYIYQFNGNGTLTV